MLAPAKVQTRWPVPADSCHLPGTKLHRPADVCAQGFGEPATWRTLGVGIWSGASLGRSERMEAFRISGLQQGSCCVPAAVEHTICG